MWYILQWNARSLIGNGQELKRFVDDFREAPDLICIQETWLKPCLDFVIPGFECLRLDRPDRSGGGCATFVKTGVQYRKIDINSDIECLAVEVWSSISPITVINYYNPCKSLVLLDFDEIMEKVRCPVIWIGDFNAHNPIWGSDHRDKNGGIVEEFLDKYELVVLNDGRPTRYDIGRNTCSHIDLSIASSNLARIGEWDVLNSYTMGSDHCPILCRFGRDLRREVEENALRYNFTQANWDKYQKKAQSLVGDVDSEGSVDNWNTSISFMIHKAACYTIPVKQEPRSRMQVPWWNKGCDEAVRCRNKAYRRLRKYPMLVNVIEYKRLRAVARRAIKDAKRNSWRKFCSTLGPETPVRHLWSAVRRMSGLYKKRLIPVLQKGEVVAVSNKEKADMFVESFQAVHRSEGMGVERCRKRDELIEVNQWKLERSLENENPINLFFSLKELKDAIRSGANTTPGRDRISYELFKYLDDFVLEEILALFNTVWADGCLPKEWKHAVVIPVLKPGKEASDPGSYRPIALTAVICKIMERMVTNRLVYFLETRGCFVDVQNGFRNGRSTMESVVVLDQDIKRAFNNKEVVVSVFLDIEKAYDSLWKEGLMIKIFDLGVRGRMFNWIKDFLMKRTIQVKVGNVSSKTVGIENGTPQGSVISPVLFNIMINDIFGKVERGFGLSLFADDGAIWKRGRNVEFVLKQIQRVLLSVEEWGNTWGFKISPSKTKYIIFGFKRKLPKLGLYMYGSPLEKVKVFKFLGVWFEERMTCF